MNRPKLLLLILTFISTVHGQKIGEMNIASVSSQVRWQDEKPSLQFSWKVQSEGRGQLQKSYHILLGKDAEAIKSDGDLIWDSKQTDSPQSHLVEYSGPELKSEQTYYWKVRLSNIEGKLGNWSAPAPFSISKEPRGAEGEAKKVTQPIGNFSSSDPVLNALFKATVTNQKKNLTTPPSFEPEELPAAAPLQLTARGYAFQAKLNEYYNPWVKEFVAAANEDKTFPTIAGDPEFAEPASGHSDAAIVIPFALWQLDGDISLVENVFQAAVDHVGAIQRNDPDFSGKTFGKDRGDFGHLDDPTSPEFLSLCFFALDCRILSEMATAIGHLPYIIQHKEWYGRTARGFQKSFLDQDGNLTEKSQTAQILALRFGLLPPEAKQPIADKLAERLKKEGLKAGIYGTSAVLPVLSWTDHHEQAVELAKSFGKEGAGPSEVALACTSEWMMSFLAGFINQAPGFKTSRISPFIPKDGSITEVKAHHETPYGQLAIHWKTTEKGLNAKVTIPPNTTGVISLPGDEKAVVTEGGKSLDDAAGCQFMQDLNGRKDILVQSGIYEFEVENP
ncbi:MAG: alpha-L-rhamnosidase C-terminal domain-containing protein [Roseibacillus sp.]